MENIFYNQTELEKLKHLFKGCEHADSWSVDCHKTLNTPYDSGVVIYRDVIRLRICSWATTAKDVSLSVKSFVHAQNLAKDKV